jgi:hypothetical protein
MYYVRLAMFACRVTRLADSKEYSLAGHCAVLQGATGAGTGRGVAPSAARRGHAAGPETVRLLCAEVFPIEASDVTNNSNDIRGRKGCLAVLSA